MSGPRQRQAHDNGISPDPRIAEPESPIEHRAARRRGRGPGLISRRTMVLFSTLGCLCLLYLWLQGGEAARFGWERENMWKSQWNAHMATWYINPDVLI
jgi:hypothetical protein